MDTQSSPAEPTADAGAPAPLLNLDTLVIRPTIAIDGIAFEIMSADELSIIDSHRFGLWGRRIQQLAEVEGDDGEAELAELVDRVARRVAVGVPAEVYARLSGAHKQAVTDVFTGLLLRNRLGVAGAIAKAAGIPLGLVQQTGVNFSQSSSASMAATPTGGWGARLRRWFGRS